MLWPVNDADPLQQGMNVLACYTWLVEIVLSQPSRGQKPAG